MRGVHQVRFLHLGEYIVFDCRIDYCMESMVFDMKESPQIWKFLFQAFLICLPLFSSGDSTARIWTIAGGSCRSSMQNEPVHVSVLKHFKGRANEKSKDVTTLDWNVSFLAFSVENCGMTLPDFVFAKAFTI